MSRIKKREKRALKNILGKSEIAERVSQTTRVPFHDTYAIISFLMDEMERDLAAGKKVVIHNFGHFELKKIRPKQQHNVVSRKMVLVERSKALRFILKRSFIKYISQFIK